MKGTPRESDPHNMALALVTPATSALSQLADTQALTLVLLALAVSPLAADYVDPRAETFALYRRDLWTLAREAGLDLPLQRFNRAIEDLLAGVHTAPAARFLRSGGRVRVALARPYATVHAEEAWRALLAAQRLRGLGVTLRYDLARFGLSTTAPLPSGPLLPVVPATAEKARRCEVCDEVQPAAAFGTTGGRLRPACLTCTS